MVCWDAYAERKMRGYLALKAWFLCFGGQPLAQRRTVFIVTTGRIGFGSPYCKLLKKSQAAYYVVFF